MEDDPRMTTETTPSRMSDPSARTKVKKAFKGKREEPEHIDAGKHQHLDF